MSAWCSLKWVSRTHPVSPTELRASGAMNDIYNVVCQAVELFCDVHLGLRTSNVGIGADERTCSTFCSIAGVFLGVLVAG